MKGGNRSQAVERLRAAASMLDREEHDDDVLELVVIAVLLIDGPTYPSLQAGGPVLFATQDAIEKYDDCRAD